MLYLIGKLFEYWKHHGFFRRRESDNRNFLSFFLLFFVFLFYDSAFVFRRPSRKPRLSKGNEVALAVHRTFDVMMRITTSTPVPNWVTNRNCALAAEYQWIWYSLTANFPRGTIHTERISALVKPPWPTPDTPGFDQGDLSRKNRSRFLFDKDKEKLAGKTSSSFTILAKNSSSTKPTKNGFLPKPADCALKQGATSQKAFSISQCANSSAL